MIRLRILVPILLVAALGIGLSRSNPDLRREIDRRQTNRYCHLSLGRVALALHEAGSKTGRFPRSMEDLPEPVRALARCCAAPAETAETIYCPGLALDMPPGMILLHEQGVHHRISAPVPESTWVRFFVRLDLEVSITTRPIDTVADNQQILLAVVMEAPPDKLRRDLLDTQRSTLYRALCAWRLGEEGRPRSRPALELALADPKADVRLQAAYALLKMGSESGADEVRRQLPRLNAVAAQVARGLLGKFQIPR